MPKTIPISVRLSHEDAEFIANLTMDYAITPSDKVRAIIRNAKRQNECSVNYEGCLKIARDTLQGVMEIVHSRELSGKEHSELVTMFVDWIAEAYAFTAAAQYEIGKENMTLSQFEEGLVERIFRLFETVARMGVTSKAPCYNKDIISEQFSSLTELTKIINHRIKKET